MADAAKWSSRQKLLWWQKREELDARLKTFLSRLQVWPVERSHGSFELRINIPVVVHKAMFGVWHVLLMGDPEETDHLGMKWKLVKTLIERLLPANETSCIPVVLEYFRILICRF